MLGSANIALAEESGGFVGFGVGYGDAKIIQEATDEDTNTTDKFKASANGASYGFVAGYKQFFNEYLGLRYYANVDLTHPTFKITDADTNETIKFSPILVNYGVNVDFLGNFLVTDIADFGGFIGFGIGANTLTNNKEILDNNITNFDIWLNLGLRTNIAKYHGIELVARVPFLPVKMWDYNYDTEKDKTTFGQTYSILARYTFSF